jgi:hypothetical protein
MTRIPFFWDGFSEIMMNSQGMHEWIFFRHHGSGTIIEFGDGSPDSLDDV